MSFTTHPIACLCGNRKLELCTLVHDFVSERLVTIRMTCPECKSIGTLTFGISNAIPVWTEPQKG